MNTSENTFRCPGCDRDRDSNDAEVAPCRSCGCCGVCSPTWPGIRLDIDLCDRCNMEEKAAAAFLKNRLFDRTALAPLPDGSGIGRYVRISFRLAMSDGSVSRRRTRWAIACPPRSGSNARAYYPCDPRGETDSRGGRELLMLLRREVEETPATMNMGTGRLDTTQEDATK